MIDVRDRWIHLIYITVQFVSLKLFILNLQHKLIAGGDCVTSMERFDSEAEGRCEEKWDYIGSISRKNEGGGRLRVVIVAMVLRAAYSICSMCVFSYLSF